jgi:hypothetical protein
MKKDSLKSGVSIVMMLMLLGIGVIQGVQTWIMSQRLCQLNWSKWNLVVFGQLFVLVAGLIIIFGGKMVDSNTNESEEEK